MDLSKELSKINESKDGLSLILEKLQKEQEIIEKKKHIFEIVHIVKKIKAIIPVLLEENITYFVVSKRKYEKYNPLVQGYTIELAPKGLLPDESVAVRDEKQNFLPWVEKLLEVTKDFDLNCKLTEEFSDTKTYNPITIDLKGDVEKQFYDILLNKELRTILHYNQLHLNLKNTKNDQKERKKEKTNKI